MVNISVQRQHVEFGKVRYKTSKKCLNIALGHPYVFLCVLACFMCLFVLNFITDVTKT